MSTRVYARDKQDDGRTRFERAAEWRGERFVKSLEDARDSIDEAMESVEKYGHDLSTDELDTVAERLERAKRRAKRDETAFTDEDGDHFFRRGRNDREKKT